MPLSERILPFCIPVFTGLLTIILCVPLVLGKVPPNPWYGVRLPAAYRNNKNWYRINRVGGWITILWGVAMILYGVALFLFAQQLAIPPLISIIAIVPMATVLAVVLAIYASRFDE